MTRENLIKDYKWFCFLASGKFTERNFDYEVGAADPDNSGSLRMGKMSAARKAIIQGDAQRNKEDILSKYPWLADEENAKPEAKPETKTKSKGKK